MKKTLTALAAALVLSLAFATVAFGQSSTEEGYNPTGPDIVNQVEDDDDAAGSGRHHSTPTTAMTVTSCRSPAWTSLCSLVQAECFWPSGSGCAV